VNNILVRKIPFEFVASIAPIWNKGQPEWSHMVNGASLTMPYLEPFLVKNMREAMGRIDDEEMLADARAFVGQEAQHYTNHRRYNEMLKHNGYPELAAVEAAMAAEYASLESRSLRWRLAYTAGFETMTVGLTRWLIRDRRRLFAGSEPAVASLVLWHMVEETEHKTVAIDVYQQLYGDYWPRAWGLFYAAWHVIKFSRRAYILMLKRDGTWNSLACRWRLWRMAARFYWNVGPAVLQALAPGHHPGDDVDPAWVTQWASAYARLSPDQLPILDTTNGDIAASFVAQSR
jgi:predicted metal-dependent hydrolase